MWEPNKKSIKTRTIILLVLSVSFVPVSYLWYGTLTGLDCDKIVPGASHVLVGSHGNTCTKKTDTHWVIFYGVNAMVYCVPMLAVILHLRKRS